MPEFDSTIRYRPIFGFPGYMVGTDGSVWSSRKEHGRPSVPGVTWIRKSVCVTNHGHLYVELYPGRVRRYVHRLVLEAFVGPCPPGMECCHSPDRDPANNRVENLRWDTHCQNNEDTRRHGSMIRGVKSLHAKLTDEKVRAIRSEYAAGGISQSALGKKYGLGQCAISFVVTRTRWKHVA